MTELINLPNKFDNQDGCTVRILLFYFFGSWKFFKFSNNHYG